MDGYLGEIRLFAGNYAPKNWAICEGTLLAIYRNTALFSLLGNIYGGDGRTTFALPDLRSRIPVGATTSRALGVTDKVGDGGSGASLGLHYIICTSGFFPSRAD